MRKSIRIISLTTLGVVVVVVAFLLYPLLYKGGGDITIVEDHGFSSLKEVVGQDQFRDKTLFIDIWGTTCRPCIVEFDYARELKEKFKDQPVEFIYLCSVDRLDQKVRWKDIIRQKQLSGYHLAIEASLYRSIWEDDLSGHVNELFLIPHYLIVKDGEIVVYQAERPSSKEKLYHQIDYALNLR